ncbi:MAG: MerR family transcriptional regulator [Vampirovibrionales bacterium]|nr:MerR family transcriptional regulator [Vampirovibrionales bacterium]
MIPSESVASAKHQEPTQALMTIGALAEVAHVTVRTLRYYEELDLIAPIKRTDGRYRLYHPRTLKRVKAILALQDLNYALEDVVAMLGKSSDCSRIGTRLDRMQNTLKGLEAQAEGLDQKLVQLQTMRQDISKRLHVLSTVCAPCVEQHPATDCLDHCEHREVHLD